jgi:hypothetical protein
MCPSFAGPNLDPELDRRPDHWAVRASEVAWYFDDRHGGTTAIFAMGGVT